MQIKNRRQLVGNGGTQFNREARRLALKSLEYAVNAADPKQIVSTRLSTENCVFQANGHLFDLKKIRNIYVVGGGKASGSMAEALEQILGKHLTCGVVNVPYGSKHKTRSIRLHEASHPIPDQSGIEGTRCMLKIVEKASREDLVVCLISGGGSSLMPLPRHEISIDDKRNITQDLLRCGATINEINTVRKHVSDFKGGWLAKKAYPATVLNLVLSDVVGDPLDVIASGPTAPDSTTFAGAVEVLKKHGLWQKAPASIKGVLSRGRRGLIPETLKADNKVFERVHNVVIGNTRFATLAACESLKSAGLNTLLLTSTIEGEARHVGTMLASVAREVSVSGNPVPKPAGIVVGGETTVAVAKKGVGGRNQEITLAAALKLDDADGAVVASLSTDGVDGPTDAAGAIADGKTMVRATELGMSAAEFLVENDSYNFFSKLGDLIFTGLTGTNVNDISVMVAV